MLESFFLIFKKFSSIYFMWGMKPGVSILLHVLYAFAFNKTTQSACLKNSVV
jgi:hypothetical protein